MYGVDYPFLDYRDQNYNRVKVTMTVNDENMNILTEGSGTLVVSYGGERCYDDFDVAESIASSLLSILTGVITLELPTPSQEGNHYAPSTYYDPDLDGALTTMTVFKEGGNAYGTDLLFAGWSQVEGAEYEIYSDPDKTVKLLISTYEYDTVPTACWDIYR